ncbi:ankyrin repeat and MYND domain-containing protein 2 [Anthonomus grandis grandis]|uniref:ankyrin repeat and MYND domain-containing protein 2 n=1 Tax=Anthonomus grandis grandis TaxID=2921223 RepID=UPI0021654C3A|nr:ankyrin repeat and MYND domain-containing protein 2 [Anthonomus grandis grandis]XP_050304528.1 ankyrin repeat and MYND domain-containing protein 2 [Anthonomus grandis grandis]
MSETEESTLSSTEKKIFEAVTNNDAGLLKNALSENSNVNIFDENRITPLQHAAYKGNKEIVQILLDHGANVNLCEHQHNYSALHFAALSGNSDICLLLLEAGAKSTETNTVGRTPSQMAAFVGHHNCVSVINNFVPKEEVEYYTHASGTSSTPYLPPFLLESFHKFIMEINIHPVKIVMNVHNFLGLEDHLEEVKKVLELMCEKEMKKGQETNEVMAFKFHYLGYIVGEVLKLKQRQAVKKEEEKESAEGDEKKTDISETFARKILKPGKDDNLEFMDAFLKECIREFPFRESTLFRQIVTSLSGSESPSAFYVVNSVINGQRGFLDTIATCNTCGQEKPAKKCSKCKVVQYCDRNCQRLHWTWHKKVCSRLSQDQVSEQQMNNLTKSTKDVDINELQNFLAKN